MLNDELQTHQTVWSPGMIKIPFGQCGEKLVIAPLTVHYSPYVNVACYSTPIYVTTLLR